MQRENPFHFSIDKRIISDKIPKLFSNSNGSCFIQQKEYFVVMILLLKISATQQCCDLKFKKHLKMK